MILGCHKCRETNTISLTCGFSALAVPQTLPLGRVFPLESPANSNKDLGKELKAHLFTLVKYIAIHQVGLTLFELKALTFPPIFSPAVPALCCLFLGHVDKRDSHRAWSVIQAGICDGDQLGTRPDVGRGVGVL